MNIMNHEPTNVDDRLINHYTKTAPKKQWTQIRWPIVKIKTVHTYGFWTPRLSLQPHMDSPKSTFYLEETHAMVSSTVAYTTRSDQSSFR